MVTDRNNFRGRLLSTHSIEVLRLRDLATRLKDAEVESRGPLAVPTGTEELLPQAGPLEKSVFLPAKPEEREGTQLYQRREAPKPTLGERLSPPGSPSRKGAELGLQALGVALTPLTKATQWYDKQVEGTT